MAFKKLLLALLTAASVSGCYIYDGDARYDRHYHHHFEHDYDRGHGYHHW